MYTLGSAEFNQIIETPNNKAIKSRLVLLDDNTIIDKIKSLILYSASCSQELQIGTTNMAYIDAEVESNLILTNREARLECGVELSDGTVEYIPMGVFTIQKPQGDIDFVKFTANDRMQKFDYPYSSTLTYPTTDKAMLEELATMCGVTLATNIDNPITIDKALDGYTRREVLGYIAGLHGKFACFNRNGELELKWYNTDTPITKNIGLIWSFEKSDEDFTVSKIEVAKNNETTLTSGNGYGVVQHSNPLATQEIVNDLFTSLNGFTYNASVVDILDDIRLDLGDVIKVTYLDGKDYLVPCMSIKQDFGQGSTNIESFAKSDTENTYRFTGPTIQYLNRMAMELLVANRVIATKVDAEYVQSHAITTDNLDAIKAEIQELIVDEIDGKYADIHLANIDIADIGLFFANSGLLKDVTIVEGHITGELDAVRINADVITTGTLSVDRLLVTGKDSIVYQINVDSSGLSETELEKEVYQKYLNGTDIVANSITATQLNVSQIFADKTVTSTLFAQDIVAIGSITSPLLKSDDYVYDGATFDGEEYSTSGMIIDLREKIIRTPKFCLKNDGSMYASEIHGGRYYGTTSTETAFIFNGFTGGTKETTDLLKVSGNTADGTTYTTYINTDNDNFSFYKPCLFPYGIKGDLTIEGNTTAFGDVIAGYGTDHQASLKTLWEQITWFGPYLLEEIDNPRQGIGINLINNHLYLSFTLGWITLQFVVTPSYVARRYYYGNNGWSSWEVV